MKCASSRTSAAEKFSSSAHFGMSACIWSANCVASPRYLRCMSCCGRSAMGAPDYAESLSRLLTSLLHRFGQVLEQPYRVVPAEARIGDALAKDERLARREVLAAFHQVRLHHRADNAPLAARDLL